MNKKLSFWKRCLRDINLIPEAIKKGFEYRKEIKEDEITW